MLTLYHAPRSRSDAIVQLVHELNIADRVEVRTVTIPRRDGSGGRDPANPHPEGKVPYLVTPEGDAVRERGAIMLYLTDRFPGGMLGRQAGDAQRGAFLSWLFWYQGVFEPVAILRWAGLGHPALDATFRDYDAALARLDEALAHSPYLLGAEFSAADLLCAGAFAWLGDALPTTDRIRAWVARCHDRPAVGAVEAVGAFGAASAAAVSAEEPGPEAP